MGTNEIHPVEILAGIRRDRGTTLTVKRILDLLAAGLALLALLPVLIVLAAAVALDSPGSPIFRQLRVGRGGNLFYMLKLRTMHLHSDELLSEHLEADPAARLSFQQYQKLWNDPRLTRLGRLLRRLSLDEIPQLVNVLRGEMSLVGPRPFLPEQARAYGKAYAGYIRVRPGLTGLWQVYGRNHLSFAERVALDGWYLDNWSLWLDFFIVCRTVSVLLSRDGAY